MSGQNYQIAVSFGDCDPAGIVFYPNILRWVDATFHHFLRPYGGHARMCADLDALGVGVVESSAQFRTPLRDGDQLSIEIAVVAWGRKTLTLAYTGKVAGRTVFEVKEVRCLFKAVETGIVASEIGPLRALIPEDGR
jgi:4-hydroxybenzoyl-CoA thioesterase